MAVPDKRCTFDNVPEGDLITAGNTATSGSAITTPTVAGNGEARAYAADAIRGTKGVRISGDDTSTYGMGLSFAAAGQASAQVYFVADSANRPSGAGPWTILRIRHASGNACHIVMSSTGVVTVQNASGTGIRNMNSNTPLPNGAYIVNLRAVKGTTTSDGRILATLRNAANDSVVDDYDSGAAVNAGTADFVLAQVGKPTANQILTGSVIDEFAVLSGSIDEIDTVAPTGYVAPSKRQTFDNPAQGQVVTVANSAASGSQLAQVLVEGSDSGVYHVSAAARGTRGVHVTGGVNDVFSMLLSDTAAASASVQVYFRLNILPTAVAECFGIRSASANVARFVVSTAGVLILQNAAGSGLKNFMSNTPLTTDTWYRLQLQATKGATTSDGYIAAQLYDNSDTLLDSYSSHAVNAGTADMTTVRVGKVTSGSDGFDMDFDELALLTGSTLEITPVAGGPVIVPPTADAGVAIAYVEPWTTVTLDGSGSTSSGNTMEYVWSQTGGPAVTLMGSGPQRTFIAPPGASDATLTFKLIVTDDTAQSAEDTVTVDVMRATEFISIGGVWQPLSPRFLQS